MVIDYVLDVGVLLVTRIFVAQFINAIITFLCFAVFPAYNLLEVFAMTVLFYLAFSRTSLDFIAFCIDFLNLPPDLSEGPFPCLTSNFIIA